VIRPGTPVLDDARRPVNGYVEHYNIEHYNVEHYNKIRLNRAVGYITPKDMLAGRQQETHAERDRKLQEARKQRQTRPAAACMKDEEAESPGNTLSRNLPQPSPAISYTLRRGRGGTLVRPKLVLRPV
jgi:hypothetical protein